MFFSVDHGALVIKYYSLEECNHNITMFPCVYSILISVTGWFIKANTDVICAIYYFKMIEKVFLQIIQPYFLYL